MMFDLEIIQQNGDGMDNPSLWIQIHPSVHPTQQPSEPTYHADHGKKNARIQNIIIILRIFSIYWWSWFHTTPSTNH